MDYCDNYSAKDDSCQKNVPAISSNENTDPITTSNIQSNESSYIPKNVSSNTSSDACEDIPTDNCNATCPNDGLTDISDQVMQEDTEDPVYHVLMPRNTRMLVGVRLPSRLSYDEICSVMQKSLQEVSKEHFIELLSIKPVLSNKLDSPYDEDEPNLDDIDDIDDPENCIYDILYMTIPNKLIEKLSNLNMLRCIFYIGLSENQKEFKVLDDIPLDKDLALKSRQGMSYPYKSRQMKFQIT